VGGFVTIVDNQGLDAFPLGLIALDEDDEIQNWNSEAGAILGLDGDRSGVRLRELFPPRERPRLGTLTDGGAPAATRSVIAEREGAAGAQFLELTRRAGEGWSSLVVVRDVTGDRQAERRKQMLAEAVQRSLMPRRLPEIDGLQLAARYRPGASGQSVRGDFYDVLKLHDGCAGLAIGDVAGEGIEAAAVMGQLRTTLRVCAFDGSRPSGVLSRIDRVFDGIAEGAMAKLLYMTFDPRGGHLQYSTAAHCPPLLKFPGGQADFLSGGRSVPLASLPEARFHDAWARVPPGASLVLYSDGLVERPGTGIEAGFARLATAAARGPRDAEALADHLLLEMLRKQSHADDVALLIARRVAG
jgi:serine phosphatase RsbU (regulator of sigma subunit)